MGVLFWISLFYICTLLNYMFICIFVKITLLFGGFEDNVYLCIDN
jgi:hypothetical protein